MDDKPWVCLWSIMLGPYVRALWKESFHVASNGLPGALFNRHRDE